MGNDDCRVTRVTEGSTEGLGGTRKFGADYYKSVLKKLKNQIINLHNDLLGDDACRVIGG